MTDGAAVPRRIALVANTDWYLYNFRLSLATALQRQGSDVVMIAPRGPYASRFEQIGLRYAPFHFDRLSLNPAQQLSAVVRLSRIFRKEKLDVAHNFTIKCAVYGSLASRLSGPPVIINAFTGLGSVFSKGDRFPLTRRIVLGTLRLALSGTRVIVQNPDDQQLLVRNGLVPLERTALIRGSGVDLRRFRPSDRIDGTRVRVLLASRLLKSKGIAAFEAAAQRLRGQAAAEFVVAGAADPGNPDTLQPSEITAMRERGNVRLLGHVDDMAMLLQTVDVVVLPTSYGEGVPRSLVEAAACGLPLIATDVPGCREIVKADLNGVLVPAGDLDALTVAIERLVSDASLRARMGAASASIAAEFSDDRVIAETLRLYATP